MSLEKAQNDYKVAQNMWRKWTPLARITFNRVYDEIFMMGSEGFLSPDTIENYDTKFLI